MRTPFAVLALFATLALAGCGETTIDAGKGETFIRGVVTKQIGAKVRSVSCPDDIKTEKGGRFTCQVTGTDGSEGGVNVRQSDDEGNVRVDAPFLRVRDAEQVIDEQITQRGKTTTTIACPEIIVVAKGERFDCTAKLGGKNRKVAVMLTDAKGTFRYRVL